MSALLLARLWRPSIRRIGFFVGLLLISTAIWTVLRDGTAIDRLTNALRDPTKLSLLALCVGANLVLSGWLFHRLYRPIASIGFGEMQMLVSGSSLLNYLPAKAGLAGRALYHRAVHGVPIGTSVRLIVLSVLGTLVCSSGLIVAIYFFGSRHAIATWLMVGCVFFWTGPILLRLRPSHTAFIQSIAIRQLDLSVWVIRYILVFALLGVTIDARSAAMAAAVAMVAGLFPVGGNGIGVREWAIGLLGPIAGWTQDIGLAADLLNRAVDLIIIIPVGSMCALAASRRLTHHLASATARNHPTPSTLST
ncbi:MAG: hypothetical protein O2800_03425 [Planctomycetota bacterium]|nr:hypothetical protein [Planctomycetota bacterium]